MEDYVFGIARGAAKVGDLLTVDFAPLWDQPERYIFWSEDPDEMLWHWAWKSVPDPPPKYIAKSATLQWLAGRTGGGPECPMCGGRRLQRTAPRSHLHRCYECKSEVAVFVRNGLQVKATPF